MSELLRVLEPLVADVRAGRPVALCAVVRTRGSTPQAAGAAMLVRADMSTVGTLGGGCVEAQVRKQAFELMQQSRSGLLDFVLNHDYGWDDGLICGGRMYVAVMPITTRAPDGSPPPQLDELQQALDAARARQPAAIPIRIERDGERLAYRLRLEPPATLIIAGAGHVGTALAKLAVDLDFRVVVIDDRADLAAPARFPPGVELVADDIAAALRRQPIDAGSFVVIVTRGHQHDHQALAAVVQRPAGYIGMIGSRRKSRMILRDLASAGVRPALLERVRTPIGLPIGAVTVPEIALSIAAELVQVRRGESPSLVEGPLGEALGSPTDARGPLVAGPLVAGPPVAGPPDPLPSVAAQRLPAHPPRA